MHKFITVVNSEQGPKDLLDESTTYTAAPWHLGAQRCFLLNHCFSFLMKRVQGVGQATSRKAKCCYIPKSLFSFKVSSALGETGIIQHAGKKIWTCPQIFPDSTRLKVIMRFYKENRTQGLKVQRWWRYDGKIKIWSHFSSQGPQILPLLNCVSPQAH